MPVARAVPSLPRRSIRRPALALARGIVWLVILSCAVLLAAACSH